MKKPTPGEKFVWDTGIDDPRRIYHPCIVIYNHPDRPWVKLKPGSGQWIPLEIEYLRKPTEEELLTLKWPDYDATNTAKGRYY